MRIVVIEDEHAIRNGLCNLLGKLGYTTIWEAATAAEGEQLIDMHNPELIISDIRLPDENSLSMIQRVRDRQYKGQIILLTGYSDFEYARAAILLGVAEYLVKPLSVDQLVQSLERTKQRIEVSEENAVTIEQQLTALAHTALPDEQQLHDLELALQIGKHTAIGCVFIALETQNQAEHQHFTDVFLGKIQQLYYSHYRMFSLEQEGFVFLCTGTKDFVSNFLAGALVNIIKELKLSFSVAVSSTVFEELSELYIRRRELLSLVGYNLVLPEITVFSGESTGGRNLSSVDYPHAIEESMRQGIYMQNHTRIQQVADEFKQAMTEPSIHPRQIIDNTIRFLLAVLSAYGEQGKPATAEVVERIYGLNNLPFSDAFWAQYQEIISHAMEAVHEDNTVQNPRLLIAIRYIRKHFAEDISLSDIAEHIHITPEHLSRLFQQELGKNFSSFLKTFRISRAKQLILSGKHQIGEVGEMVGYPDKKYFSRVFKEVCGTTPSDYRRNK